MQDHRRGRRTRWARLPILAGLFGAGCIVLAVILLFWRARNPDTARAGPKRETGNENTTAVAATADGSQPPASAEPNDELYRGESPELAAEILGRFVDSHGTPIAGVSVRLARVPRNDGGQRSAASDADWLVRQSDSAADGRFSIAFHAAEQFEYDMRSTAKGRCSKDWTWQGIEPSERKDLGDVVLDAGGTIVGHVLGARGEGLSGLPWRVSAVQGWPDLITGQQPLTESAPASPETGDFEITGLAPGLVTLRADLSGTHVIDGPRVQVRAGQVTYSEIVCPFADIESTTSVRVTCPPFEPAKLNVSRVVAITPSGGLVEAQPPTPSTDCFRFDRLPPGNCTLRIDDPRYLAWSQDVTSPGSVVEARLTGSATVSLNVIDAVSANAPPRCEIFVQLEDPTWASSVVPVSQTEAPFPVTITGLLPVKQSIIIRAIGYAEARLHDVELLPNETRNLNVQLTRGSKITGRVTGFENAKPGLRVQVYLVPRDAVEGEPGLLRDSVDAFESRSTFAEPKTGDYAFDNVESNIYQIQACASPTAISEVETLDATTGQAQYALDLRLPPLAYLSGMLRGAPSAALKGTQIELMPIDFPASRKGVVGNLAWSRRLRVALRSDGSYRSNALPATTIQVSLRVSDTCVPYGSNGSQTTSSSKISLGEVRLSPGENTQDFDVRGLVPGTALVSIQMTSAATSGVVLEICSVHDRILKTQAGAVIDSGASQLVGPVSPGEYQALLRAADSSWYWLAPEIMRIQSGEITVVNYAVPLVSGTLMIKGIPTAPGSGKVEIRVESPLRVPPLRFTPNENGEVHLALVTGRYTAGYIPAGTGAAQARVAFEWSESCANMCEIVVPFLAK